MSYMNRMNKFVSDYESMEYRKEAVLRVHSRDRTISTR